MRSDAFRAAVEAKDWDSARELFTDDVVFRSPVVFKPYEGLDALMVILRAVSQVFTDFRYVRHLEEGATAMLSFEANVDDRSVEGIDILDFDAEGRIERLTVMVRPMSGMHALAERMRAMLESAGAG